MQLGASTVHVSYIALIKISATRPSTVHASYIALIIISAIRAFNSTFKLHVYCFNHNECKMRAVWLRPFLDYIL